MDYVPVRTSTIRADFALPFKVFLKLDNRFLLYIREGDEIDIQRLKSLKSKKVRQMYIESGFESSYQKYLDQSLDEVTNNKDLAVDKKSEIMRGAVTTAVEDFFENPTSESSYSNTQTMATKNAEFVKQNPEAVKTILTLTAMDYNIYQHSMNVSTLSVQLADLMGADEAMKNMISTASLIHDVGKAKLSFNSMKPMNEFTKEEKSEFDTHGKAGVELLADKPYVSKDILDIVMNHEETLDGRGPNRETKLPLQTQIVALVNRFDRYLIVDRMGAEESWKKIMIDHVGQYDLNLINKMKEVLVKTDMWGYKPEAPDAPAAAP